jgi:glycerol-3-phosphate dehydrogenase
MTAGSFDRRAMLARLAEHGDDRPLDVLVVGGGITGCGVALDAASRGLRTALVEAGDFASGTSSKSSKLIHGGLRYLQQGEVRLVYEALRERERLRRNAPHLLTTMPFMIPILTKDGVVSRKIARALGSAMWMYDLTGGWRIGKLHRRLRKRAALAHFPTMPSERLASAHLYFDAAADDARLCLTVARTAAAHGAIVANRCRVVGILHNDEGAAIGATVEADGRRIDVHARVVVNAAGVWTDEVRRFDEGQDPDSIRPAKGVHVTVPWEKVRNDIAVVIPVPGDRRNLFLVPWGPRPDGTYSHTYVGTTDTDHDGALEDPQCDSADLDYVLRALRASVTTDITRDDVTAVWSGLRPLVKASHTGRTADLSRRHQVSVAASGMITVTGGKLTTYRQMAEDAVDTAIAQLGRRARCRTRRLRLWGHLRRPAPEGTPAGHLERRFGTDAAAVRALVAADPSLGTPLVTGLPYLRAEAVYAARHEMATTLDDVLERRTRAHLFDRDATRAAARDVALLLAPELGWDADEVDRQVAAYEAICERELAAARPTGHPV